MYPFSDLNNWFIFDDPEKNVAPAILLTVDSVAYDISHSVSSFGSISRSMEYDTAKWTPSRHSFKIDNTKDFSDYFYSLRKDINGVATIGKDYWMDLEYDINYNFPNSDQSVKLYRGVISSKTEDRIKERVSVSSTDILKSLVDTKVCVKMTGADVFDPLVVTNIDDTEIQPEIRYGKNRLNFTWATKKTMSCTCVWSSGTPIDHSLITTSEAHGLVAGDYITISGTTNYNGTFQVYRSTGWNPGIALTAYQFWIAKADSGWPAEAGTLTLHNFTETEKVNNEDPAGMMVGVPNKYAAARKGESTASASTAGFLWYFPIENFVQVQLHNFYVNSVWYWDYMIGQWCRFEDDNGSNVNCGYTVETVYAGSTLKGFYLKFREGAGKYIKNEDNYYERKWGYFPNITPELWANYLAGNGGAYWQSPNPQPKVAIEFNGYVYTGDTIAGTYLYSNPVAEIYNMLSSTRFGSLTTELDYYNFASPDTTYSFDSSIAYYASGTDYANGAQMNVNINEESTLMEVLQDTMVAAGIMIICSTLRSTDQRVRLIPVRPYDNFTDRPNPILTYSTLKEITALEITTDYNKHKNKISLKNYLPPPDPNTYPPASDNYFEVISEESGDASKEMKISMEDRPPIFYFDSNTYATRTATNYLGKLDEAYEDLKIELDDRAILVDCGDYIIVYDHKVNDEIVAQVYSWSFNIDNGLAVMNAKKVYSSLDVVA